MNNVDAHHIPHGEILIAEDNMFDLRFLSDLLTEAGYRVRPAGDGELALRSVQARLPDLILLDIQMPAMSGLEVCRRLKADPATGGLPILIISAQGERKVKLQAFEAGAVDYVVKPFDPSEVLARIGTHMNMRRLQQRLETQSKELLAALDKRKQMEQQIIRLERLRAIGDLSAGVSHNLNNILTSVLGPAQILQRITDDPQVLREAASIVASAIRARDLVRRLRLSVTGKKDDALQAVAVGTAVREAVQMTRSRWKDESEAKGIAVEVTTDLEDTPPVKATVSGLSDILVNLVLNAVDAMPERGTLFISTQTVEDGVRITVRDTGVGMDGEVRRRVFEPFFTTKMDVGSGLGLSTAYGMVTRWGGRMDVQSAPGEGTTFTVWLPAWTGPEEAEAEKSASHPARSGRILIVEDDAGVRDLLSRLLDKTHDVETARNGSEALTRSAPGRCDAAIIDLGLPGIPGDRLLTEMQGIDPSVVGILITGWDLEDGDARGSAFDFHIRKPFGDIADVERAVADAVALHDERAGGRSTISDADFGNSPEEG